MKQFLADSTYHQLYVADRELEPEAPTEWTDQDLAAHHLTLTSIAALCPESHINARVTSCGPNDPVPNFTDTPDFEVLTSIEVPSCRVGVYSWPWELEDEYELSTTHCKICFRGYALQKKDAEQDYYLVHLASEISP